MIQRMKNKAGTRYLASTTALELGAEYAVSDGPAKGQRVRPTAALPITDQLKCYDFDVFEGGAWHPAN